MKARSRLRRLVDRLLGRDPRTPDFPPEGPPDARVREPRQPRPPQSGGAVALEPPPTEEDEPEARGRPLR